MDKILFDRATNLALSASAGTGKTRTLSLRFLDLYLKYQNPASIYALTFTNKAAQEMRERIIHYLNILSSETKELTEEEKEIARIFGSRFKDITRKARLLKHHLLSNFTDFNVSTIHSFLNSILKTIPFHTNVLPDFRVIEETEENILIDKVLDDFLNDAINNSDLKILVNRILDPKYPDVKNTIKVLFLSLLPRMLEIREIIGGFKEMEEKLSKNFDSFKLNCSKLTNLLKKYPHYKNKNLEKKMKRIESFFPLAPDVTSGRAGKQGTREKIVEEIMDLLHKSYFKKLEESWLEGSELENLTKLLIEQARDYTLLHNRKLLIDNLKLLFALYERFQDSKTDMNVVTFNDLETYALRALPNSQTKEYLYFKSSSQIEHLLIDEFQDTSIIQWRILEPIVEEITAGENHSFFYVGDPNQAIYRFRGGESRLFNHIPNRFPGKIQSEYLTENYRSKEEIVSFVNNVFSSQPEYKPMKSTQKGDGWVVVENLGEYKQKEGLSTVQRHVVEIIESLKKKGYDYSDVALLVRRNETSVKFSEVLEKAGIPTRSESKASLIYQEGIQDIVNLLRWVINPLGDFYLSLTLLSPLFSIGEKRIEKFNRDKNTRLPKNLFGGQASLFEFLEKKYSNWPVTKKLQKILCLSDSARPYELISFIYSELKVIEKYKCTEPFLSLLESAYKFENEKGTSLSSFIEYFHQYGSAIELTGSEMDGVQILTCHKAKGLEFPVVLLPETVWNMEGKENDQFVFEYNETEHELKLSDVYYRKDPLLKIFKKEIFQDEKKLTFKDELNNLYVAMTRAKEGLWIIGYKNIRLSKPVRNQRNQFLKWSNTWFDFITNSEKLEMKNGVYTSGKIVSRQRLKKQRKPKPHPTRPTRDRQARKISSYQKGKKVFTPTEESLILSDERRDVLRWGEIYHYVLSKIKWVDEKNIVKTIHFSIDTTKRMYARSKKEQDKIAEKLNPVLRDILTDKDLKFIFYANGKVKVKTEVPIYFKRDRTEIFGKIDRLIIRENSVEIVDYKKSEKPAHRAGGNEKYIKQMQNYQEGLSKIYPDKKIKSYLLWLDNPRGERIERVLGGDW